jgi:hypothetical protein
MDSVKFALSVDGRDVSFSLSDVLADMKIKGDYSRQIYNMSMSNVVKSYAGNIGLFITEEGMQAYSDQKRQMLGLETEKDTRDFFSRLGIDEDNWERAAENELIRLALRQSGMSVVNMGDAWNFIRTIPEVRNNAINIVLKKAENNGITINDAEVEEESDTMRRAFGLHKASDFEVFLRAQNMTTDDWESLLKANLSFVRLNEKGIQPITSNEIIGQTAGYGAVKEFISFVFMGNVAHSRSGELGLSVSDDELNEFVDNFRRANNLHDVRHFKIWLSANNLSPEQFEEVMETRLMGEKFMTKTDETDNKATLEKDMLAGADFIERLNEFSAQMAVIEKAKESGIIVSDDHLNEHSDNLRRAMGLHSANLFTDFINSRNITMDDWEAFVERDLLVNMLRDKIADKDSVSSIVHEIAPLRTMAENELLNRWKNENLANVN